MIIFCDVILCNLDQRYQHFGGICFTLSMDKAGSSTVVLATSCQTTWHHTPEDNFHSHCCQNIKSHKPSITYLDDEDIKTVQKRQGKFMSQQKDVLCPKYHAEWLKYMRTLQRIFWKLKKSKTFLHSCWTCGSTASVHCLVGGRSMINTQMKHKIWNSNRLWFCFHIECNTVAPQLINIFDTLWMKWGYVTYPAIENLS